MGFNRIRQGGLHTVICISCMAMAKRGVAKSDRDKRPVKFIIPCHFRTKL
jgi:hypothetical protein